MAGLYPISEEQAKIWRMFTKDKPAQEDLGVWRYDVALLEALGVVLHLAPAAMASRAMH
ncbi:MAG TPA: hypothetical protein VN776_11020 [Terracidiphilus sp.]|nr:hypothetical protein [Terracidiphilus sp.]